MKDYDDSGANKMRTGRVLDGKPSRRNIEAMSKVRSTQQQMLAGGRHISQEKIAELMGISEAKWLRMAISESLGISEAKWLQILQESLHQEESIHQIANLPNPYRACVLMRFALQQSAEAIARQQDTTPEQVRFWIDEGLQRLRSGQNEGRQRV
jgi:hypothetical protein